MLVSPHAVLRFVKRYRPDLTEKDAAPILTLLAEAAERIGRAARGGELYRVELADGRRLSMVVRDDPTTDRVVVTVLPPNADTMPPEEVDEIVEAFERISSPPAKAAGKRATVHDVAPAKQQPRDNRANAHWVERTRLDSLQRDLERARRHGDRQNLEYEVARDALKIAIRALIRIDSNTAYTAIERIRAIEPAWLSEGFVAYEPDEASMARRAERRRAMTGEK